MIDWVEANRKSLNPVGSVAGSLSTAVLLFLVFRLAVDLTGVEALGIWSLLQGVMVFSRISDVGAGTNLTRLIAVQVKEHQAANFGVHLATGMLLSTLPTLVLGLIVVSAAGELLHFSYPDLSVSPWQVAALIWCSFLVAVLQSLGNLVAGCLDGYGRMFERGILMAIANFLAIPVAYYLLKTFGPYGIGLSYIFLASVFLLASVTYLAILNYQQIEPPTSNVWEVAKASWRMNVGMIYIGVLRLVFEPTSKILIGEFGGLHYVAFFDLANRVTAQLRMLMSSASQSLLPLLARQDDDVSGASRDALIVWTKTVERWTWYVFSIEILATPLLSHLAFGAWSEYFGIYFLTMSLANTLNALGLTAYYAEVARGRLGELVRIHIYMAALNLSAGVILGVVVGSYGVVMASGLSIAYGGLACLRLGGEATPRSISSFFSLKGQFGKGAFLSLSSLIILILAFYLTGAKGGVVFLSINFLGLACLGALLFSREVAILLKMRT